MKKILVAEPMNEAEQAQILAAAGENPVVFAQNLNVDPAMLQDVQAVIGNANPTALEQAPNLEWVQLLSSGADVYAARPGLKGKFTATTATGCYGTGISEYMVGMLMLMMKKIPRYLDFQKDAVWGDAGDVYSPMGKKVLIVGTGNLGTEFAKRIRPFGPEIIGVRRRAGSCPAEYDRMCVMEDLPALLPEADVVALCLPGTAETYHLFDSEMLKRCKPGAYLMNVGRGTVIPTEALLDESVTSSFAGIWVDVLETEPLPQEHPLWRVPNLIITPHITGYWHLDITRRNAMERSVRNLKAYLNNEPLECVLDWETGYCK